MVTLTGNHISGGVCQVTGKLEFGISYVEAAEPMSAASFGPPAVSPDGEGGVDIHSDLMIEGYPYPLFVNGIPLVAIRESDGSITLYGFQGDDD